MIDPSKVAFFIPPELARFKLQLFERIAETIYNAGGLVVRHKHEELDQLPPDIIPVVGCSPQLTPLYKKWRGNKRDYIYWDRGYFRRSQATCLPIGDNGGYYRFHLNSYQLQRIREVPDDRWRSMRTDVLPWQRNGRHIVIAAPTRTYAKFHQCESWIADTIDALARVTDRQLVIRDKEQFRRRPIQKDLEGAHCLVTHGSNSAVESVILGCPVVVHPDSAAALVGLTNLDKIEKPVYPDREPWMRALSYSHFSESELVDGTLWRLIE